MASSVMATATLVLTLNLLFFTLVTSSHTPKGCPPPPCSPCSPKPPMTPSPKPPVTPSPKPPMTPPKPPMTPSPKPPMTPSPKPPMTPPTSKCPIDTLKLGVCGDLLSGLVNVVIGSPPKEQCCSLIQGVTDVDAAVCLCTAIKANVLGINLNVPVSLSLLLNYCDKKVPSGFECS